jgi:hypothetical protein
MKRWIIERFSRSIALERNALFFQILAKFEIEGKIGSPFAVPDFLHLEVPQDGHEASQMVRMGMGEDDAVELSHPPVKQIGPYHLLSYIEVCLAAAPAIDQHRPSRRQFQEGTIPLPHVQKSHPQVGSVLRMIELGTEE